MATCEISGEDVQVTRRQLLEYFKMDTLAMVRLHETFSQLLIGWQMPGGVYVNELLARRFYRN
jgi:hypothetical protein